MNECMSRKAIYGHRNEGNREEQGCSSHTGQPMLRAARAAAREDSHSPSTPCVSKQLAKLCRQDWEPSLAGMKVEPCLYTNKQKATSFCL